MNNEQTLNQEPQADLDMSHYSEVSNEGLLHTKDPSGSLDPKGSKDHPPEMSFRQPNPELLTTQDQSRVLQTPASKSNFAYLAQAIQSQNMK